MTSANSINSANSHSSIKSAKQSISQQMISDAALEQAALWFIQLEQGTQGEYSAQERIQHQREFDIWLQLAEHQAAWQKILIVSQTFAPIKQTEQAEQTDIASKALTNLHQPNQRFSRRAMLKNFAVAAAVGFTWQFSPQLRQFVHSRQAQYQTTVGEISQQQLSDGSQIWLNTNSAVDTMFSQYKRELVLYHGELYISTASNPVKVNRPFSVNATLAQQPITYTALGTEFIIEQHDDHSRLSVFKGRVAIDYQQQRQVLSAGEQVMITEKGFGEVLPAETDSLAWQQREFRAKNITLADFCRQLERYHRGIITLNEQAALLRVVGIFPIFDLQASLQMLAQSLPITINQQLPWWTRIS